MRKCPMCKEEARKVIYCGFPMLLCSDDRCNGLFGFWAFVMEILPFLITEDEYGEPTWAFYCYEDAYPLALCRWLMGTN